MDYSKYIIAVMDSISSDFVTVLLDIPKEKLLKKSRHETLGHVTLDIGNYLHREYGMDWFVHPLVDVRPTKRGASTRRAIFCYKKPDDRFVCLKKRAPKLILIKTQNKG